MQTKGSRLPLDCSLDSLFSGRIVAACNVQVYKFFDCRKKVRRQLDNPFELLSRNIPLAFSNQQLPPGEVRLRAAWKSFGHGFVSFSSRRRLVDGAVGPGEREVCLENARVLTNELLERGQCRHTFILAEVDLSQQKGGVSIFWVQGKRLLKGLAGADRVFIQQGGDSNMIMNLGNPRVSRRQSFKFDESGARVALTDANAS